MIAGIHVGSEDGLVLATQDTGHLGSQAAQDRAIRIELVPFVLDVSGLWGERAHVGNASGKQVSTGAKACGDTAAWAAETS